MNYCGVCMPTIYGHYVNNVEVVRARNRLYNDCMNFYNDTNVVNKTIGTSIL